MVIDRKEDIIHRIKVAMGKEKADIIFYNCKIVSVFTEEILEEPIAISNGKIVSIGDVGDAYEKIDLKGAYISPSFIDSHIHIESSMLSPEGFAEAVVPHGTSVVISDPHEIVNVLGLQGWKYMIEASNSLPLDIYYTIPSCVPATDMETAGAKINATDIKKAYNIYTSTPALSEMMNYPGVFLGIEEVIEKICIAQELGLIIDGHSPMLRGKFLNAYLNAGIITDHECTNIEEAYEKLRKGMWILIREGSAAKNLKELLNLIKNNTIHRICISSDDRHPDDLLNKGHLDYTLKLLLENGISLPRAIRLMTLNPALLYGLSNKGGIAPSYEANLVIFDNPEKLSIKYVYYKGKKVAENGELIEKIERKEKIKSSSINIPENFKEVLQNNYPKSGKVRAIGILESQILTENLIVNAEDINNKEEDLCYLAVIERHGKSGNIGLGFVKGLGIKEGAIASTVAHDSHNLIVAGKSIESMIHAIEKIKEIGGGFVVVKGKEVIAYLPLPIGGLMSNKTAKEVSDSLKNIDKAVKEIGIKLSSPFMTLSFLALPVIPHLKLTDKGLVDVDKFKIVELKIA